MTEVHHPISVRLPLSEEPPGVEVGVLVYAVDRDYWRYVPHRHAEGLVFSRVGDRPRRFLHAESDPSLPRLKRRLKGAGFMELTPK